MFSPIRAYEVHRTLLCAALSVTRDYRLTDHLNINTAPDRPRYFSIIPSYLQDAVICAYVHIGDAERKSAIVSANGSNAYR